jgi:hypothetical protein
MCWGCGTQPVTEQVTDADEEKLSGHLIKEKSLGSKHVGDKINMNVEDYVVKKIMEEDEIGQMSTIFEYRQKSEVIFRIIPEYENENSISAFQVLSNICKTDKEIGIGSTIKEFTKAYSVIRIWCEYDTGLVLETEELRNIWFYTNHNIGEGHLGYEPDWSNIEISELDLNKEIVFIKIF